MKSNKYYIATRHILWNKLFGWNMKLKKKKKHGRLAGMALALEIFKLSLINYDIMLKRSWIF